MTDTILEVRGLGAGYDGRQVLDGIDFDLNSTETVCLLGHNGAGKSTLVKCLYGLLAPIGGKVFIDGREQKNWSTAQATKHGIALVPEGRGIFPSLRVDEVIRLGLWAAKVQESDHKDRVEWVLETLPQIKSFYTQRAGSLSGGQQQMVSIARALLGKPRCLLLDEPSIGLAPKLFHDLLGPIMQLQKDMNMSVLIVEQNVHEALKICHRVAVMKSGAIIRRALPGELESHADLMELY